MGLSPCVCPILLAFFFLSAACSAAAAADDPDSSGPALNSTTHATGKNGSTLKWTPSRTSSAAVTPASASQRVARNTSPAPTRVATRAADNAMSNPFGDSPRTLVQAAPLDDVNEPPVDGVKPGAAPSKLPTDMPARLADPPAGTAAPKPAKDAAKVVPAPQDVDNNEIQLTCPKPTDKYAAGEEKFFKSISELTTNINVPEDLRVREGMKQVVLDDHECKLDFKDPRALDPESRQRWTPITFTWRASGLCHKPLYFEDVQLERYGHSCGPFLQPIASGAHFFLTVPLLPYKMGLEPPDECMYTLGYYRPGSCAPYMLDPIPLSVRAGLAEAGVVTGLVFLVP